MGFETVSLSEVSQTYKLKFFMRISKYKEQSKLYLIIGRQIFAKKEGDQKMKGKGKNRKKKLKCVMYMY